MPADSRQAARDRVAGTVRLTVAQALIKYLMAQETEIGGETLPVGGELLIIAVNPHYLVIRHPQDALLRPARHRQDDGRRGHREGLGIGPYQIDLSQPVSKYIGET